MRTLAMTLIAMTLSSATFAAPPTNQQTVPTQIGALPSTTSDYTSACAKANAADQFFIPENFMTQKVRSKSGKYGYVGDCPFWVVDFKLNNKSNSYVDPNGMRIFHKTLFRGIPYDLPSSSGPGGDVPTIEDDCKRSSYETMVFTKFNHEPNSSFTLQRRQSYHGKWSGAACSWLGDTPDYQTLAPKDNVLVVRVVTRVKERTSWQEAAGSARRGTPS